MNSCNTKNRTARIPRNAAGQYNRIRRWRLLPCILFLAVSFGIGAMLLMRSDGQVIFQIEAEAVQAWTKFPEETLTVSQLVDHDCEDISEAAED